MSSTLARRPGNTCSRRTRRRRAGSETGKAKAARRFEVDTEPPEVKRSEARHRRRTTRIRRSRGRPAKRAEVVVHVFTEGRRSRDRDDDSVGWQMVDERPEQSAASGNNTFTAFATEKSGIGNAEGKSATVTFEVNTQPPDVTMNRPPLISNNATPGVLGHCERNAAGDRRSVQGRKAEGKPVAKLSRAASRANTGAPPNSRKNSKTASTRRSRASRARSRKPGRAQRTGHIRSRHEARRT